jgi:ferrous iron transport protein A
MAHSFALPGHPGVVATRPLEPDARLAAVSPGVVVRVVAVSQDREVAAWLRAVGLSEGAEVTVLRRAPFGGPIHIRTSDGGEFAVHRDLARSVTIAASRAPESDRGPRGRIA